MFFDDFYSDWREFYGTVPPLSFLMRDALRANWRRFHYLPGSKRYAENEAQRGVTEGRLAVLAAAVFAQRGDCWIVRCEYARNDFPEGASAGTLEGLALHPCKPSSFIADFAAEDDETWNVFAVQTCWDFDRSRKLLWVIADDQFDNLHWTLWFSPVSGRVFAPYDGGADIFSPSECWLGNLAQEHGGWLSEEPSGL